MHRPHRRFRQKITKKYGGVTKAANCLYNCAIIVTSFSFNSSEIGFTCGLVFRLTNQKGFKFLGRSSHFLRPNKSRPSSFTTYCARSKPVPRRHTAGWGQLARRRKAVCG